MATFEQLRHADGMYAYCQEVGLGHGNSKSWDFKHFQLIEDALDDDEKVFVVFVAFNEASSTNKNGGHCAYAVTSKRIIMAQQRLIGNFFQTVSLKNVNDITYSTGLFRTNITIDTSREQFTFSPRAECGDNVHYCLLQGLEMARAHNEPTAQAPQSTGVQSLSDELVKLKQLVDSGILTQDEFDAKKKQMLGI